MYATTHYRRNHSPPSYGGAMTMAAFQRFHGKNLEHLKKGLQVVMDLNYRHTMRLYNTLYKNQTGYLSQITEHKKKAREYCLHAHRAHSVRLLPTMGAEQEISFKTMALTIAGKGFDQDLMNNNMHDFQEKLINLKADELRKQIIGRAYKTDNLIQAIESKINNSLQCLVLTEQQKTPGYFYRLRHDYAKEQLQNRKHMLSADDGFKDEVLILEGLLRVFEPFSRGEVTLGDLKEEVEKIRKAITDHQTALRNVHALNREQRKIFLEVVDYERGSKPRPSRALGEAKLPELNKYIMDHTRVYKNEIVKLKELGYTILRCMRKLTIVQKRLKKQLRASETTPAFNDLQRFFKSTENCIHQYLYTLKEMTVFDSNVGEECYLYNLPCVLQDKSRNSMLS